MRKRRVAVIDVGSSKITALSVNYNKDGSFTTGLLVDEQYGGFDLATNKTSDYARLKGFYDLDKAGFDQIPCGTNWVGEVRERKKVGADDVIGKLVALCRRDISPQHLKGFLMAPWASCDNETNLNLNLRGIDLFAAALD